MENHKVETHRAWHTNVPRWHLQSGKGWSSLPTHIMEKPSHEDANFKFWRPSYCFSQPLFVNVWLDQGFNNGQGLGLALFLSQKSLSYLFSSRNESPWMQNWLLNIEVDSNLSSSVSLVPLVALWQYLAAFCLALWSFRIWNASSSSIFANSFQMSKILFNSYLLTSWRHNSDLPQLFKLFFLIYSMCLVLKYCVKSKFQYIKKFFTTPQLSLNGNAESALVLLQLEGPIQSCSKPGYK